MSRCGWRDTGSALDSKDSSKLNPNCGLSPAVDLDRFSRILGLSRDRLSKIRTTERMQFRAISQPKTPSNVVILFKASCT